MANSRRRPPVVLLRLTLAQPTRDIDTSAAFHENQNTTKTQTKTGSPECCCRTYAAAKQSAHTCLALRPNNPYSKRSAPRVREPGHPAISASMCLAGRFCGTVPTFPGAFRCLPGVLYPRYQDVVARGGVLDLDLGAQFVELEVGFQAFRDG